MRKHVVYTVVLFIVVLLTTAGAIAAHQAVRRAGIQAMPVTDPFDSRLPAAGTFLVASPAIEDPRFQETVILLIQYDKNGAIGVIVNRPTDVRLAKLFPHVRGLKNRPDIVHYGGPVEGNRVLMLFRSNAPQRQTSRVFGDVFASTSKSVFERAIGTQRPANTLRMYAGHAGWFAGQLEREIRRGDWYLMDADTASIFDADPSELWHTLYLRASAISI